MTPIKPTPPGYKPSPLQMAKTAEGLKLKNRVTRFTPQFSPEVKKGIQRIIDPTGANVGRQAVPMRMKKGGKVSSASSRADGCAIKGKTKGRII